MEGRAYQAGLAMGLAIIEMVELMYQKQTQRRFYHGLLYVLRKKLEF